MGQDTAATISLAALLLATTALPSLFIAVIAYAFTGVGCG